MIGGARFWVLAALLAGTAGMLNRRGDHDKVPPAENIASMPNQFADWTGHDLPIDDEVLQVLGKGDFLNRVYTTSTAGPSVGLFVGYFPTQRTGQAIHSPQHCLPGAGWTFESSKYTSLTAADGKPYQTGEYVITNGETKQFVLYWYQSHGRSIANEYVSKAYMIADAIRLNRTDGALVRVITPVLPSETLEQARARAIGFTQLMATQLPRFIPS